MSKERKPIRPPINETIERGGNPSSIVSYVNKVIGSAGIDYFKQIRAREVEIGLALSEAEMVIEKFKDGVNLAIYLAEDLLRGESFPWWDIDSYKERMQDIFIRTSRGQFAAVLGSYALNRICGMGPIMIVNHEDLFPNNDGFFLDALTNATVTNFGQGFPPYVLAANSINRITGGTQCCAYHPGPLLEVAAEKLISITPIPKEGAKVAWFNSGGDAVSVAIAAAEKYTTMVHGKKGRRRAVYFKEAYHGNIEGRAGRITSGINEMFYPEDRNSIQMDYPSLPEESELVLEEIKKLIQAKEISCVVFESTQGDGGGVSMHPDFFIELMKMSLDEGIPLIVDEIQSGFGRSGKRFDVEYLLDYWRNSTYVINGQYPAEPPFILTVGKSITNGIAPGSAVVFPKEYAVLERAQGLTTYSGYPATLLATIITVDLMRPTILEMVRRKREIFNNAISSYVGPESIIKEIRGHGLHVFLSINGDDDNQELNQQLQVELLGKKRILTGTVGRNGLRVHAPINAPDIVWEALGKAIGEVAMDLQEGRVSHQTLKILKEGGPSGLAKR